MARSLGALVASLALAAVSASAARELSEVTPLQKVIQLLEGMVAKGKKEKQAEQMQFAAYKTFCDTTQGQKQTSISEANEKIDVLKADIEMYTSDADTLGEQIAVHDEDISCWEGDVKAATKVREIENEAFLATQKDYITSIKAIDDGIKTLQEQAHDVEQASASLLQVSSQVSVKIPEEAQQLITAFLSQDPDSDENLAVGAPEAAAHQFHGQGLVDMLTKLQEKFVEEQTQLEKNERSAMQSFETLTMDLASQIEKAKAQRTEKSSAKAKALEGSADASADLKDTSTLSEDDTKYLQDLSATCEQKAAAFAERQTLRSEEIEAIQKAIEILSSGAVSGGAAHLPKLVQMGGASLAQLRSGEQSPAMLRVAAYLESQATAIDSRVLAVLAVRVKDDPMKKIKKMIKDLIVKLMEEANAEAESKGFCDTEMSTNEQTRTEKSDAVETLKAEIGELTASISKLTEEIAELRKSVADAAAAVEKATGIRAAEKEKNAATIQDAQEAQTAVAQALGVLKEFYDKAAKATSLVQEPEIFSDEPYKGMGAENGGVVGMIEVIQSDFARLESETTAAEQEGQKEYEQFMADTEVDKTGMVADIEHKTGTKQNQEQALEEKKTDLDGSQKELDAAMAYWEKLKPQCVDQVESYEDRVARRKAEIESLQEALKILTE